MTRLLRALTRIGVFAFLALAIGASITARVRAEVSPAMMSLGAHMLRDERSIGSSKGRTLLFNGVPLRVSTTSTTQSVSQVLRAFERSCQSGPLDTSISNGNDAEGFAVCTVPEPGTVQGPVATLRALASGGGLLRYVYAARDRQGTSLLSLWSETPIDPARVFPAQGDAPGDDPTQLPRPPGARRLLSFREHDESAKVYVYAGSPRSPHELVASYRAILAPSGWNVTTPSGCEKKCELQAERGHEILVLLLQRRSTGTDVTIMFTEDEAEGLR